MNLDGVVTEIGEGLPIARNTFELDTRTIHVWIVRTSGASPAALGQLREILAPSEKERAARFRFDHLQRSFVAARAALRILLGRYIELGPADLRFEYGANGKPLLRAAPAIHFNASHAGGIALFGFARTSEIGIDVEHIRAVADMEDVARRFFSAGEYEDLMTVETAKREQAFFRCWTRKEAYIKAVGDGLSLPLDSFRVTLRPAQPARFLHLPTGPRAVSTWTLRDLNVETGYVAALAYPGEERPVLVQPVLDINRLISIGRL